MKFLAASLMAVFGIVLVLGDNQAGEKAKYTIKEVMKEAHKDKLLNKVYEGNASADEKKHLAELYKALSQNDPPKGEKEDWKKKTTAMVKASAKAADGDEKAAASLKGIVNCGACHKAHK